jgi:dihydroflavonol-4-reductase
VGVHKGAENQPGVEARMSPGDPVLVTGASGFVGSAVVKHLVEAGWRVRALLRPTSPRTQLAGLGVEYAEGDINAAESVARAVTGVRYVFHVAADYRLWARQPSELMRTNVEGTRTVMLAAQRAGVERIVYTSSVATLAPRPNGESSDESSPLRPADAISAYKQSKVLAERLVETLIAEAGLPAVIVNPSAPIGPRDVRPTPTGRIIVEAASGRMPGFVDTGLNLVHVDDVAAGHLAALREGRIGERYILGGQNVALAQMLADIARLVGRSPPRLRIPRGLLFPLALAAEAVAQATGREPFATVSGLRMAKYRMYFTSAKAERELGYRARPYGDALADAIDWFRRAGYLKC